MFDYDVQATPETTNICSVRTGLFTTLQDGKVLLSNNPPAEIIDDLIAIQNSLRGTVARSIFKYPGEIGFLKISNKKNSTIIEVEGARADIKGAIVTCSKEFPIGIALSRINELITNLAHDEQHRERVYYAKTDTVIGVFLAATNIGPLTCALSDIQGNILYNVLIGSQFYNLVILNVCEEDNVIYLYNDNYETVALIPMDDSVLKYFTTETL